jgi:bacteriocin biosynthesis cyclodehydratase domain-containing protein
MPFSFYTLKDSEIMADETSVTVDYINVQLPEKPRLAPWITLVDLGDNRLQLRGAEFSFTLQHPLFIETFQSVRHLLDGQRTVEEIVSSRDPKYLPTTITFLLKMLRANGILQEGVISPPPPLTPENLKDHESLLQFFSHYVMDPAGTLALLHSAQVALIGSDSIKIRIQQGLLGMGFDSLVEIESLSEKTAHAPSQLHKKIISQLKDVDILIACQDTTDYRFFQTINAACLETQTRWMHVAISGTKGLMGPTIIPHQSACYACYDKRLASNASELQNYLAYQEQTEQFLSEGVLNPLWTTLAEQVTLEVVRIISGFAPPKSIGRVYEFEATTPLVEGHDVLRLPRCPACNFKKPKREAWDLLSLNQ